MSNRLFQSIVHQMKDAVDRVIGVVDQNGFIISCSELARIGEAVSDISADIFYTRGQFVLGGYTYSPINSHGKTEYLSFVEGDDSVASDMATLIGISLSQIKTLYDEKYDKASFVKNIILDNILPSDIYLRAKELRIVPDVTRVVYLIKFNPSTDLVPVDLVQNLFPDKNKDFVISVGEYDVALVREIKSGVSTKDIEKIARGVVDTLSTEFYIKVVVGIGTPAENLKELARAYKEAQVSIEVGKVFDTEKNIVNYESLGIGRLIYQLPNTLCEMFLNEVFKRGALESLDRETLMTIQSFFENNLNVSETSRRLFVHRNTLVYRLDKIKKLTGLDLRDFDHAITFKVAMMVKRYLTAKPIKF